MEVLPTQPMKSHLPQKSSPTNTDARPVSQNLMKPALTALSALSSVPKADLAAAANAVPLARPKYVPIRPAFRPLLPKPLPSTAAGPGSMGDSNGTLTSTAAQGSLSKSKPKVSSKTLASSAAPKKPKTAKPKAKKATKATKSTARKQVAATFSNDPNNASDASNDSSSNFTKKSKAPKKKQTLTSIPVSVSPASLITKRTKSTAGSGLVGNLSPLHIALSAESSNLISADISSLPSPHSSPSSPFETLESFTLDAVENTDNAESTNPPLDDWASQTADEILAASTDDFFWLSPESLVSDTASITTVSSIDTSMDQSLSLTFQGSTPETDLDDFYKGDVDLDNDPASYLMDQKQHELDTVPEEQEPQSDVAFDSEPFCSFEYSPEPVNLDSIDPYGFLDLAITI